MSDQPPNTYGRSNLGCAWIAVVVSMLAWGGLAWTGYSLWSLTKARVPDSPYLTGQWNYYVGVPLLATIVSAMVAGILFRWKPFAIVALLVSVTLIFALLPYLLPYTGGV